MTPLVRGPHRGRRAKYPCYETADGAKVYECIRCGKEFTILRPAGAA